MAQFAMDRPDPHPEQALNHLDRIHGGTARENAVIRFCRGKAHYQQKRYDLAEVCWKQALEIDALVPEAGWRDLIYSTSRDGSTRLTGLVCVSMRPSQILEIVFVYYWKWPDSILTKSHLDHKYRFSRLSGRQILITYLSR